MKKILLVLSFVLLIEPLLASPVAAKAPVESPVRESYAGLPLCLPDAYLQDPGDCVPLGPSVYITNLAKNGVDYPFRPLAKVSPDPEYTRTPDAYITTATKDAIPIYPTLADAQARNHSQYLPAGNGKKYFAFQGRVDTDSGIYYQTKSGYWIEAGEADAACCIYEGRFQGLIFKKTPHTPFGWIVEQARPRLAPNYQAKETGQVLERETVVQIYDVITTKDTIWYMIGVNEWIDRRFIRQLEINPTPPEGVTNNRWIEVNLFEQTLSVYDNGQLVFATLIATGRPPFYTRPGLFKIYKRKATETMTGSFEANKSDYYYLENVPWTMYFDEARALHGAYWHTLFGYEMSHGCVNLSIGDSRWLYDWAKEGDSVYVWDPSGKTPTDPKFYGKGGA
jgi:lipoprotein-anchoring transpeptidase ErfK/SrfK